MIAHPKYDADAIENDVGIFKLARPISCSNIDFADLASKGSDPKDGATATAAGWYASRLQKKLRTDLTLRGNTWADDTDGSILLQEVDLPIISRKPVIKLTVPLILTSRRFPKIWSAPAIQRMDTMRTRKALASVTVVGL